MFTTGYEMLCKVLASMSDWRPEPATTAPTAASSGADSFSLIVVDSLQLQSDSYAFVQNAILSCLTEIYGDKVEFIRFS